MDKPDVSNLYHAIDQFIVDYTEDAAPFRLRVQLQCEAVQRIIASLEATKGTYVCKA